MRCKNVCLPACAHVTCISRTLFCMCIEYCVEINVYHVSARILHKCIEYAQGIHEHIINVHYYYYYCCCIIPKLWGSYNISSCTLTNAFDGARVL